MVVTQQQQQQRRKQNLKDFYLFFWSFQIQIDVH